MSIPERFAVETKDEDGGSVTHYGCRFDGGKSVVFLEDKTAWYNTPQALAADYAEVVRLDNDVPVSNTLSAQFCTRAHSFETERTFYKAQCVINGLDCSFAFHLTDAEAVATPLNRFELIAGKLSEVIADWLLAKFETEGLG